LAPYETHQTIELHRQALRREAEQERLLAAGRAPHTPLKALLARTGRWLVAVGTRLEARYAAVATVRGGTA
jgi:hypothetical protein